MLVVSDIHGNHEALRRVAQLGQPLIILGDFLNYVDYRTGEGMVGELLGIDFSRRVAALRANQDFEGWRQLWAEASVSYEDILAAFTRSAETQYTQMQDALAGSSGFATFGNVDVPQLLSESLPPQMSFVHGDVVDINGYKVGFVGGAKAAPLTGSVSVSESDVEAMLESFGRVDILCSHVPPAIDPLRTDVITGRQERSSEALLRYIKEYQPMYHLFGDVHQPQASRWAVGATKCQNVGYFRATGRPFELDLS